MAEVYDLKSQISPDPYTSLQTAVVLSTLRSPVVAVTHTARGLAQVERPMSQRVSYRLDEAAKTAGIGLTKLREEIAAKRLRARKLGSRTIITRDDLVDWAARLPDVHDVVPNTVAKRVARAEVAET